MSRDARVWLGPDGHPLLAAAIERGGGSLVEPEQANAIVWHGSRPERIRELVHPGIEWVQLDSAGVDAWLARGLVDRHRVWTAVHDVFAPDVAEHAVALVLAASRRLAQAARRREWAELEGERLAGRTVGIVGAGAIGRETIARLAPFGVTILALTRSGRDVPGADRSVPAAELHALLAESDFVILAAPLTAETRGLVGARELELIGRDGWLVNVARGAIVVTDALVEALEHGRLGGACLDVTDPEPLPPEHPLWRLDNVLVTPHVANPPGTTYEPLARLVEENVRRFRAGRELRGAVDLDRGY
ncbi:MAG: hydroxyacid dehydrogenase [Actinomycetota bacterium]|nr:hydroxyacid dehydrogenase [Actinomycetota bacterium]